jgi:isoleucyl-tRNA synthetase
VDYKQTVNLPQTDFPMKADLARREPEMLAWWKERDVYGRQRRGAAGRPSYTFVDGPPYANGAIHLGHAVNKVLKDIVVKAHNLDGYDAPFIPGWDCHGLPIEHQVEKKYGRVGGKLDAQAFRAACRTYAAEQVEGQKVDFVRLGVLADWDRPYLTMLPGFEANQLRAFSQIWQRGHVYKGYKPVHWCLDCRSSLAEAEVEYEDRTSPSIDVRYPVVDAADLVARLADSTTAPVGALHAPSVVIWTTTPWTLPASQAVTVHPEFEYVLARLAKDGSTFDVLVAQDLLPQVLARAGVVEHTIVGEVTGARLEGLRLRHPFYERVVPVILGEHVTLDAGTGAVHTAPGHGLEDYVVGQKYGLAVDNPVGGDGRFLPSTPLYAGLQVFEANERVLETLRERGVLLAHAPYRHSYPHCWRHKTPVIFRATPQWFIGMEREGLRRHALAEIRKVKWTPGWGENRIYAMIENRPDWCISRQRTWGVPIPLFLHRETGEAHPRTVELIEQVAQRVEQGGIDAWFALDAAELLGPEAAQYEKSADVMDVWFDSGVVHWCLATTRPEAVRSPADLYLEGSDQHRGWFHSSLLTSVAMHEHAPYRGVLTHGFTVDDKGRKMSKSLGNVILPQKVIGTLGADVLRLWVASTDYANEIAVSDEILKRSADSYRRMRNTVRFLLGNLAGFDPARDAVPLHALVALDRWAIERTRRLQDEIVEAYREHQFHLIYQKIHNFCVVDLGAFWLDVLKDRLYTTPAEGAPRRSAQTALWHVAEAMVRWLAPILSFTAEEIWRHLPKVAGRPESVFLSEWHVLPADAARDGEATAAAPVPGDRAAPIDWDAVIALKADVARELERLRTEGRIGAPLEAIVDVWCEPAERGRLAALGDELRFVLITSGARVRDAAERPADAVPATSAAKEGVWISVTPSAAPKCARCWHLRDDVGSNPAHPEICGRCVTNVEGPGELRRYA